MHKKRHSVSNNNNHTQPSKSSALEAMPHLYSLKLAINYGCLFLIVGILLPYLPVWLEGMGLGPTQIGAILFMQYAARILTSGQVTLYADQQNDRATVYSIICFGAALTSLLFFVVQDFWPILIVAFFYFFFFNPATPVLDAIALAGVRRFNADYGFVRTWGSIVFIITNLIGGYLLTQYGSPIIIYLLFITSLITALASLFMPRIGRRTKKQNKAYSKQVARKLWKDKHFVLVVAGAGLVQASHALLYGFGSIYWQSIGIGGFFIGILWGVGVISEIALFRYATKLLQKISPIQLLLIGAIAALIRWAIFPFIQSENAFLVLQILHGLSFGAAHIGLMHFIMDYVPEEHLGAGQGVGFVLGGIIFGALFLLSGTIYEMLGTDGYYIMVLIAIMGAVCLLVAQMLEKSKEHNTP